jgi:hypothetical protein
LVLLAVGGCQTAAPDLLQDASATATAARGPDQEQRVASQPVPVNWAGAGDCLDQLKLLHELAAQGRLDGAPAPPFAVGLATPASGLEWVDADAVPLVADLPLESYQDQAAAAGVPCLLLVEQPGEVHAAHRVVDFAMVASEYQSGLRSERNPDYDVAQARVRDAERETKRRRRSVLGVGDPMLDLVGLVVGGVIAAFDQVGSDDDLDDALAALKETPRSRDRPVYSAYEFERRTVRAGKEATIGVALRDLERGRTWGSEVKQREMRQLFVLEDLDPRDRDYEQHRAGAMSREEFEHWQRQPPQLPMSALVAALIDQRGTDQNPAPDSELIAAAAPAPPAPDWLAQTAAAQEDATMVSGIAAVAPSGGPGPTHAESRASMAQDAPAVAPGAAQRPDTAGEGHVLAAAADARLASVVRLDAGSLRGNGVYVRPRLVVTTADLVGATSVIDVTTSAGESALGLVVHTDLDRNIALVHVPRAGRPALLPDAPALSGRMVDVLELIEPGQARLTRSILQGSTGAPALRLEVDAADVATSAGAPVFLNDRAVALVAAREGVPESNLVPIDALDALLESEALAALH